MQVGYTENYKNIYTSKFGDQSKVIQNEKERNAYKYEATIKGIDHQMSVLFRNEIVHSRMIPEETMSAFGDPYTTAEIINDAMPKENIPLGELLDKQAEDMATQKMIKKARKTINRHKDANKLMDILFSKEKLFPCTASPGAALASGTPIISAELANEMIAEKRQREANTFNFAKAIEDQVRMELEASEESESSEPQIQAEAQKQEEPIHAPSPKIEKAPVPVAAPAAAPKKAIGKVAFRFLEQNAPAQEAPKPAPRAVGKIAGEAPKSPTTQVRGRSNTVAGSNPSATPANSENMQALRKMVSGINLAAMMPGARPVIKKEEATTTSTTATTTNEAAPTNNENNSNAANGVIKHLTKDRVTGTGPKRRPPTRTRNIAT